MSSAGSPTTRVGFVGSPVGCGRGPAARACRVCPCARVAGIFPGTVTLACASWNGTPCYPGVVTTLLVNAATSGAVRSSQDSVCVGPERGNTGPRLRWRLECYRRTPRERPWVGSRVVSCSRELNKCLTSSNENSSVTLFERLVRAFCVSVGTER